MLIKNIKSNYNIMKTKDDDDDHDDEQRLYCLRWGEEKTKQKTRKEKKRVNRRCGGGNAIYLPQSLFTSVECSSNGKESKDLNISKMFVNIFFIIYFVFVNSKSITKA